MKFLQLFKKWKAKDILTLNGKNQQIIAAKLVSKLIVGK